MAFTNWIPVVWSARLLAHLDSAHVLSMLVNRDYEGEISQYGDRVKINQIGNVTIKDYTQNSDIDNPEELTTEDQTLVIDQQKYFNFQVDDIDKAQMRAPIMDQAMSRAGYGMADVTDKYLASLMVSGAASINAVGSDAAPVALTSENAYDYLVRLKVMLDKRNVPAQGRWVVVPPEYHGLLLLDKRFVGVGSGESDERLKNGHVGSAAGFNVHVSNNLPYAGDVYKIVASYNGSTSYAEQISSIEPYRMEKRFADAVKGLHVYGAKVTRPKTIAVLTAKFDSGILDELTLTSAEGSAAGKTKVTAFPACPTGYTAKYKTAASVALPAYNEVVTGYTAFTPGADITATTGNKIVVAYLDSEGKAKAAGIATVVSKA